MKKIALFPGSFDPFTKGHEDIVRRGLGLFDEVHIAIGHNTKKQRHFSLDKMIPKMEALFEKEPRIKIFAYEELTANYAKKIKANFILRGLRNTTDFEYENSIAQVNKHLNDQLETVFLITSPEFAAISSSIIREVHKYNGDVSDFVPFPLD
ncbi:MULTISPECIES: pantetheine-phosphate adenylyltransferase [Persicobacter]|uniref:Phosphopantetheine adenylyltransferase n=1 Tax=Persicobacter diffluens TaxID=981 RepID=A0AAN5AJ10_9BACT|nr:pantetheine-phosphate adenylyltransferase [Persicobacter sp. CCB-QB2]GJM61105.1 phosphopantetheine adenylyltransferase [Persicobacter diffluens]